MLKMVVRNSKKLIRRMSASDNIRIGRYLTKADTARQMAQSLSYVQKNVVHVLDAGAGTGILSAAVIEEICRRGGVGEVFLTCYENSPMFLPMLEDNMERLRKRARHDYHVKVRLNILHEDFLLATHPAEERYDYIMLNPPQELAEGDDPVLSLRPGIFTAASVSLAPVFTLLAAELLSPDGQLVAVMPVSAATAAHLTAFRRALFSLAHPEVIFLYTKEGRHGTALRKNMVLKLREGKETPALIRTFVSRDDGTPAGTEEQEARPYAAVVSPEDAALTLLSDRSEQQVMDFMASLPCSFDTFHLKVHTGLTLESRYPELLRDKPTDGAIPLIHPRCLHDGVVTFPRPGAGKQYIVPNLPSLRQNSKNILLIKRVPPKSGKRRVVCAPFLAGTTMYRYISTHNKLNYIDVDGNEQIDPPFLYGLHAFLSSEPVDRYIRIVSKTAQLNAADLTSLPLPTAAQLRSIGAKLMAIRVYKPEYCDRVVRGELLGGN